MLLEVFYLAIVHGIGFGIGAGVTGFVLVYAVDWLTNSRPLKTDSREIVRMHGWEEEA